MAFVDEMRRLLDADKERQEQATGQDILDETPLIVEPEVDQNRIVTGKQKPLA